MTVTVDDVTEVYKATGPATVCVPLVPGPGEVRLSVVRGSTLCVEKTGTVAEATYV